MSITKVPQTPTAATPTPATHRAVSLLCALVLAVGLASTPANAARDEIRDIQQMLTQCGFDPGAVNGSWGQKTAMAAADYIRAHGRTVSSGREYSLRGQVKDLIVSAGGPCPQKKKTEPPPSAVDTTTQSKDEAGRNKSDTAQPNGAVRAIQKMLAQCGFDPGPADGDWGQQTARAATQFLRAHDALTGKPRWNQVSDDEQRAKLIAQVNAYRAEGTESCPAPGSEIWECETPFSSAPEILLTADHAIEGGTVKMGTIPIIKTHFTVEGLERAWRWVNRSDKQYAFTIGPHGAFGLRGFYFDFSHDTDEDDMVESQAAYSCEQTARP